MHPPGLEARQGRLGPPFLRWHPMPLHRLTLGTKAPQAIPACRAFPFSSGEQAAQRPWAGRCMCLRRGLREPGLLEGWRARKAQPCSGVDGETEA